MSPPDGESVLARTMTGTTSRLWTVVLLATLLGERAMSHYMYPLWAVIVAPAMGYAWGADYLLRPLAFHSADRWAARVFRFSMALIPMAVWYGLIGLVDGNPLHYVAGDTFKYLLTPLGFYLAAVGIRSLSDARWLLRALAVFAIFPRLDIGTHLFALTYLYGRKAVYWKRYSWLLLLPVIYLAIRVNRTSLLLVPLLTVALYYYGRRFRLWHIGAVAVTVAALGFALYRFAPTLVTRTGAYGKSVRMIQHFTLQDYHHLDPSTYQRIQEAVLVVRKFEHAGWLERVFGFGSGAVFKVTALPRSQQVFLEEVEGGYAHHIHLSPVFVYHQWGVPGIALLAYSVWALLTLGWRLARRRGEASDPDAREQYSLALAAYLMAMGFFLYCGWNPPKISLFYFGLLLGTLWRLVGSWIEPQPRRPLASLQHP